MSFFFLMIRRPPRSTRTDTRFPYTTLFRSTVNRSITRIAVLDDPHSREPGSPFDAGRWDRRVYWAFGESCGVGYHQGVNRVDTVLGNLDLTEVSADNLLINRSEEHTSELQSLMRTSYAVFCLKKKTK